MFWQLSGCSLERSELRELQQNHCSGQSSSHLRSTLKNNKKIKKKTQPQQGWWGLRRHPSKYWVTSTHTSLVFTFLNVWWFQDHCVDLLALSYTVNCNFWEGLVTWPTSFFVTSLYRLTGFFFMQNVKGFWHSIHSNPKYPYLSCVALNEWFNKRWIRGWRSDLSSARGLTRFLRNSAARGRAWPECQR